MDYKYIDQLLERYWNGETTLEEEQILRTFFSQKNVPESLDEYVGLFVYEQTETETDVLGTDFDERIMSMIGEQESIKAKVVTMKDRFAPLFKAAAVVAIILTLSNAAQMSFHEEQYQDVTTFQRPQLGRSVALTDSAKTDTVRHAVINVQESVATVIIK